MQISTPDKPDDHLANHRKKYLFRMPIQIQPLLAVLSAVAPRIDSGKWFHFNVTAYRKMIYQQIHLPFIESIRDYYFPAKWRKYGDKELTYSSFTTILRQMCNEVGLAFYTKIVYDHSVCNTVYFIATALPDATICVSLSDNLFPSSPCSVADTPLFDMGYKQPTIVVYNTTV